MSSVRVFELTIRFYSKYNHHTMIRMFDFIIRFVIGKILRDALSLQLFT
jgi:hypothetical protein